MTVHELFEAALWLWCFFWFLMLVVRWVWFTVDAFDRDARHERLRCGSWFRGERCVFPCGHPRVHRGESGSLHWTD